MLKKLIKRAYIDIIHDVMINGGYPQINPSVICMHCIPRVDQLLDILLFLKKRYKFVRLEDVVTAREPNTISLTFDDGYKEWAHGVSDILVDQNVPATFFVSAGIFMPEKYPRFSRNNFRRSNDHNLLDKDELISLARNDLFEIGSHSVSHPSFSQLKNYKEMKYEIEKSKEIIEEITCIPINKFAYPFGGSKERSPISDILLCEAGFEYAFTIVPGNISGRSSNLGLPRYSIDPGVDKKTWLVKLSGFTDFNRIFV